MTGLPAPFDVPRETAEQLDRFAKLLLEENERQNLISKTSAEQFSVRHLADSAQLIRLAPPDEQWLDIGSGPGLPGMVLAILGVRRITLVEPRRLRTDFLARCRDDLQLDNVEIVTGKVEQLHGTFDVVTVRAVASITRLFELAHPLTSPKSRWVLPKGRSAAKELEEARVNWQGEFRLEPSLTDPDARILVADKVRRRTGRG